MKTFIVALTLVAITLADTRGPWSPFSPYKPLSDDPPQYTYAYAVKDEDANLDFNAAEDRDRDKTTGGYMVLLADGRRQMVTYVINGHSGFVADVRYKAGVTSTASYNQPSPPSLSSISSKFVYESAPEYLSYRSAAEAYNKPAPEYT
ncbi:hypothetical protein TCAL_08859 [Tigriopus californicus]|uniref:Cuticle protein 7 n=1 Tax=Tigriopus californicus TaxID=6832 RepID=A0A553PTI7_TIGCA|nr:pro-resilin-like [Tigriopus californicus]TRY80998.1 hypothetical protein TCAL_08859 [Tigriopus californicus]|eukprot:TCALIF_08859-PA protein Name:"Similar to resilin Pro-resilin (Drosophila melanogaster)" AED:0.00 eAED:0.00 QI:55/1/1/1/1/1/2/14/147